MGDFVFKTSVSKLKLQEGWISVCLWEVNLLLSLSLSLSQLCFTDVNNTTSCKLYFEYFSFPNFFTFHLLHFSFGATTSFIFE